MITPTISGNRIKEIRRKRGLSQQQLADLVGAHWVTISNLERGKAPLTFEWLDKLGSALKTDWADLVEAERPERVFLGGAVYDGTLDVHDEEPYELNAAVGVTVISAYWMLVADNSLYPAFQRGDVLRVVTVDDEDTKEVENCIGRLCAVQHANSDGPEIGYLGRGDIPGTWNLTKINGSAPSKNVQSTFMGLIDRALFRPNLPKELEEWLAEHQKEAGNRET